jgi:hypothetical protein
LAITLMGYEEELHSQAWRTRRRGSAFLSAAQHRSLRKAAADFGVAPGEPAHSSLSAAMHESGIGPPRHVAAPRDLGRKRGIAEVEGQPFIAAGDAFDPTRTSAELAEGKLRFSLGPKS